jgi:hypothetical protein
MGGWIRIAAGYTHTHTLAKMIHGILLVAVMPPELKINFLYSLQVQLCVSSS